MVYNGLNIKNSNYDDNGINNYYELYTISDDDPIKPFLINNNMGIGLLPTN